MKRKVWIAVLILGWTIQLQLLVGQSSGVQLRIADQIDLHTIAAAHISIFGGEDRLIASGQSDEQGIWILSPECLSATHLLINHPNYFPLDISLAELKMQGFSLFLEPRSYEMEPVVFSASKFAEKQSEVAQHIQVISSQEIAFQNPQTSADLLAQQGAVFVQKSQMGGGSPNLRGFEANKVLLVLDGVRMNNAIYRSGHLQNIITIDPSLVERTEVLFGPGSVMYGSDALGGVINFITRKPIVSSSGKLESEVQADVRYGSASQEKRVHVDLNLGRERWASLSSVSITDFGDLRTGKRGLEHLPDSWRRDSMVVQIDEQDVIIPTTDSHVMMPTAYRQVDLAQKFLFLQNDHISHSLNLQYSSSTDIPRFDRLVELHNDRLRYAEWYYGPQERLLSAYTLKSTQVTKFFDAFTATLAYQQIEESRHNRALRSTKRNHRTERLHIGTLNLDATKQVRKGHILGYGIEFTLNQVHSSAFTEDLEYETITALDTRYPDGGSLYRSSAMYATHKWNISKRLTLSEGIRISEVGLQSQFEDLSFFDFPFQEIHQQSQALSGNLSLTYRPNPSWQLSALASTGFRAPNLDDVAKVFDSQPGNVVVPNPDLQPEYTYNTEFSIEKRWATSNRIGLTGFISWYDNAIVVRDFQVNGRDSIFYEDVMSQVQANVNANQAFFGGFSTYANIHAGPFRFFHTLTYTYGQILDPTNPLPMDHIPPLFGRIGAEFQAKKVKLNASMNYQGKKSIERYSPRDLNNFFYATPEGSPGWWTLNLKTSWAVNPHLRLLAGAENILDQHYRSYSSRISAAGRHLYLAVKAKW